MNRVELPAGVSSRMEFFMRFALWAERIEQFITAEMVVNHFGVSRATAYRYLDAWKNATGRI